MFLTPLLIHRKLPVTARTAGSCIPGGDRLRPPPFILLFLSSSANSQNEAQTRSKRVGVRMAAALSGKRAHSGSHGQTGAIFSSFCLSAHRPPKVGPGFCPELQPAYSRTRCLPCRKAGNLHPDTMQTAYLSSSRKDTKMVLSTREFHVEGRYG